MNSNAIIDRMSKFPACLNGLLVATPPAEAHWKPESGAWSIVEVINHLADEETEDFRARLAMTLEDPTQAWPLTDPEGWATERSYNDRDLAESLERFALARRASVEWLRALVEPNWDNAYNHPSGRTITAADLLTSWCIHDVLHLRQLSKRLLELTVRDAPGRDWGYAGEW